MSSSYVISVAHQVEEESMTVCMWIMNTQLGSKIANIVNLKVLGSAIHKNGKNLLVVLGREVEQRTGD